MMKELFNGNNLIMDIVVYVLGAIAYGMTELLYRGHTHWTMLITGGACILTIYYMWEYISEMPLFISALVGAIIVTCYEFFVGVIVNLKLEWSVWDYSAQPFNLAGQICLEFTAIWYAMCFVFFGIIKLIRLTD